MAKKKSKTHWLEKLGFLITCIGALALIMAWLGAFVKPSGLGIIFGYFALAFPFLLIINIFLVIFFLFTFRWYGLIALAAILLNLTNIQHFARFKSQIETTEGFQLKLISFNANLFDFYTHTRKTPGEAREDILAFLEEEDPDIICFQEYRDDAQKPFVKNYLRNELKLPYFIHAKVKRGQILGNVIVSRYPILSDSLIVFERSGNMVIWADIDCGSDTLRVINFHLQSIGFKPSDDNFYEELTNAPMETENLSHGLFQMHKKIFRAFSHRGDQANIIAHLIKNSPHPVMVCGDLNDVPASYAYRTISKKLEDSFSERSFGLGTSYAGAYPSFRIDYIFHSPEWRCLNFQTIRSRMSDHYPIIGQYQMLDKE